MGFLEKGEHPKSNGTKNWKESVERYNVATMLRKGRKDDDPIIKNLVLAYRDQRRIIRKFLRERAKND